ncbi:MAG TPA: hypothetical protein PKA59_11155 [Chakrabartia sp.]|jgi:hypothetical protein|nr:hypothetical protein [Chakrabartia sp.]
MKTLPALALSLAALSLPVPALAQSAKPCMTAGEAQGLVTFALPDLLQAVAKTCKTSLAPTAYLSRSGDDLVGRYRETAEGSWPVAKAAIVKIAGKDGAMMAALPDEATKALISAGISTELSKSVKPTSCQMVSDVMEQLAPLPPQNMSNLLGIILEAVAASPKMNKPDSSFSICPRRGSTVTATK